MHVDSSPDLLINAMDSTCYPHLQQLLSGYFHQDWCNDHASDADVLADYVESNWRDEVSQTIDELDRYLGDHPTNLLAAVERDFTPMVDIGELDGEARQWFGWIRDQLAIQLGNAPLRPARN